MHSTNLKTSWKTDKIKGTAAFSRSQWPSGARRTSAAARLLRLWVRIPPGSMDVCLFKCCVMSGRGLCDALITRPEESYQLWCVVVCDLETSWMRRPWPTAGCRAKNKQTNKLLPSGNVLEARVGSAIPTEAEIPLNCFVKTVSHHTPHRTGSNLDRGRTGVCTQRTITL